MTRHDRPFGPLWRARVIRFAICIIVTTIFRAIPSGNVQPVELNLTKTGLVINETLEQLNGSLGWGRGGVTGGGGGGGGGGGE